MRRWSRTEWQWRWLAIGNSESSRAQVVERTPDRCTSSNVLCAGSAYSPVISGQFDGVRQVYGGPLLVCIAVLNKRYPYSLRSNSSCCSAVCGFEHARRSRRCHCLFDWREREWWLVFGRFCWGFCWGLEGFCIRLFIRLFIRFFFKFL